MPVDHALLGRAIIVLAKVPTLMGQCSNDAERESLRCLVDVLTPIHEDIRKSGEASVAVLARYMQLVTDLEVFVLGLTLPPSPSGRTRYPTRLSTQAQVARAFLMGGPNGPFSIVFDPPMSLTDPGQDNIEIDTNLMAPTGTFDFAVAVADPGRVRISTAGHSSQTWGGRVFFAGEIMLTNGNLISWNNSSGHYMPLAADAWAMAGLLNLAKFKPRFPSLKET